MPMSWLAGVKRAVSVLAAMSVLPPSAPAADIEALTRALNRTIPEDTLVVRLVGRIDSVTADELAAAWSARPDGIDRLLLDLESPGGSLAATEQVIAALGAIRAGARVDTLVRHGAMCASACVAVFMQGEDRAAGGASVWMFHGVCYADSNVPSLSQTGRFLDLLRDAGASEDFLCRLEDEGFVTTAGKLWISGYELYHVYKANVITRLLEPWRRESPILPERMPFAPR
ncbi:MAG: hypothetical protein KDJ86_02480 [Bauldia sp.]|uniref:hypothetical protein n=1 Tax=Bauldia sp. TaxID=2575872 RepID=UPI001D84DBB6|nr:hypothetical protein [Bauldia sp.]MCB1494627.1 hypothetical protein [Bauldia sp.]